MPDKVNESFLIVVIISLVLLGIVTFFMIFLAVRYRKANNPSPGDISGSLPLEIAWTVVPAILVFIMFWYGWENFRDMRTVPGDALTVNVHARMWSWNFEYENGLKANLLRVPAGRPVNLIIISDDVLHSLFIPAFKVKEDAVPGMKTRLWFKADRPGEYDIYCSEYCGQGHSSMISKVVAMEEKDFHEWYESSALMPEKETTGLNALKIMEENGCLDCHSTDGSVIAGPSFKGLYGTKSTVITEGKERVVIIDEEYLRTSILHPDADVKKGYPDIMPSFEGELTDGEMEAIIEYIEHLK